ncbi:hypothetical protein F7725_022410 [Dissostichus mawsoni]|uniref:Uncharacterized protein n=1 Tax=Dissostichus mawsoni TaxID=36200 RepID=A0A7J5YXW3_DISMA|nr:hypothetical protein F7725_022410 [Dissostichus mawsoni]
MCRGVEEHIRNLTAAYVHPGTFLRRSLEQHAWRFDRVTGEALVVVHIGTNDVASGLSPAAIVGQMESLIDRIQHGHAEPLYVAVCSILPRPVDNDSTMGTVTMPRKRSFNMRRFPPKAVLPDAKDPVQRIQRWDKANKTYVEVERPYIVGTYNKYMGGVDLFDSFTAKYKFPMKSHTASRAPPAIALRPTTAGPPVAPVTSYSQPPFVWMRATVSCLIEDFNMVDGLEEFKIANKLTLDNVNVREEEDQTEREVVTDKDFERDVTDQATEDEYGTTDIGTDMEMFDVDRECNWLMCKQIIQKGQWVGLDSSEEKGPWLLGPALEPEPWLLGPVPEPGPWLLGPALRLEPWLCGLVLEPGPWLLGTEPEHGTMAVWDDGEPETKHNDAQNSSDSENEERIETESENEEKETGIEKEETGIDNEETGTD